MGNITFEYKNAGIDQQEISALKGQVELIHKDLHNKKGLGSDYLGWLDYPESYDTKEFERIKKTAEKIVDDTEVLVVVGIGGSYLGAKAIIEAIGHSFCDLLEETGSKYPYIIFAGNNLSSTYLCHLLEALEGKEVSLNVVSKSGTTTEPAIAFRVLKDYMYKRYGKKAKERIYITTDSTEGSLRKLARKEGYETFNVPDDVGGRYSVLTPVAFLPMAVGGSNLDKLMEGAKDAMDKYNNSDLDENDCYKYAAIRNILYRRGKESEFFVSYEPALESFAEWWKQLFGESEGKDGKGILPISLNYTRDLHSMGQYIQDGRRNIFETTINIEKSRKEIKIPKDEDNIDGLNYLAGKTLDFANKQAMEGVMKAHLDGGVPNLKINVPAINSYNLGQLIYFFEKSCAVSGYLLGVNPFDQPGVEAYKKNMLKFLQEK